MASSSKGHGSVKTVEWWKHLRDQKRTQERLVRNDGKRQVEEQSNECLNAWNIPDGYGCLDKEIEREMIRVGFNPDDIDHQLDCWEGWREEYQEYLDFVAGR